MAIEIGEDNKNGINQFININIFISICTCIIYISFKLLFFKKKNKINWYGLMMLSVNIYNSTE